MPITEQVADPGQPATLTVWIPNASWARDRAAVGDHTHYFQALLGPITHPALVRAPAWLLGMGDTPTGHRPQGWAPWVGWGEESVCGGLGCSRGDCLHPKGIARGPGECPSVPNKDSEDHRDGHCRAGYFQGRALCEAGYSQLWVL